MGPHPETPVDVQKYIGSCLITQQPRSKRKSCPRGQIQPKDGGGRCTSGSGYCAKSPMATGFNSITNYAWTGVPLISVARQNKNHHLGKNRMQPRNPVKAPQDYSRVESPVDSNNLDEILPIARLAIHAQGAPLILQPKDSDKVPKDMDCYVSTVPYKGHDFYLGESGSTPRLYMLMPGCPDDMPSQQLRGERTSSGSSFIEDDSELNSSRTVSSSPSQSDCISTTSEDSGTSENGLPRIIKPRKRRKKDRRLSEGDTIESPGTIVTLKPYQPLCYRYSSSGGTFKVFPKSSKSSSSLGDADDDAGFRKGVYPYPPSPRCRCPYCVPPPSTLLTPPDSPVSEDSLLALASRSGGKFSGVSDEDSNISFEESALKAQNTLVCKYPISLLLVY